MDGVGPISFLVPFEGLPPSRILLRFRSPPEGKDRYGTSEQMGQIDLEGK